MEASERLILPIRGVAKPRMTRRDRWKKRPVVEEYWAYKDSLRVLCSRFEFTPVLSLQFYFVPPKSWSKKRSSSVIGFGHTQRPDLDNLIKGFTDALLEEDSFIHTYINCGKYWWHEDAIVVESHGEGNHLVSLKSKRSQKGT